MALRIATRLPRLAVLGAVLMLASATLAVGAAKRMSAVRWGVAGDILTAWVLTFPASALVAGVSYLLLAPIFG